MKSYEIYITDWARVLFGNVPPSFYIEIVLRCAFIYILLMVSMRLMGKRMAAQLSRNEMVAMVSLAAAIGVPILAPDRGLLPVVIIALIVVSVQRIIASISFKNQNFERIAEDDFAVLIEDGLTFPDRMRKNRISQERLFAQLRSEGILHLGQVRRLYLEAPGSFTLIREDKPRPGLAVLPLYDKDFRARKKTVPDLVACGTCGNRSNKTAPGVKGPCDRCGASDWHDAFV